MGMPFGSVFMGPYPTPCAACFAWDRCGREHGCDGTRSRLFCASGGYVAMRKSTSLKARDGSPAQGCRRCGEGEAVCESQTRPDPSECRPRPPVGCDLGTSSAGNRALEGPTPSVADLRQWGRRRPRPPPTATSPQAIATPPFVHPETNTTFLKKKENFSRFFAGRTARTSPGAPPDGPRRARVSACDALADCAVGSG